MKSKTIVAVGVIGALGAVAWTSVAKGSGMKRQFRFEASYTLRVGSSEQHLGVTGQGEGESVKEAMGVVMENLGNGIPPQVAQKTGDVWANITQVKVTMTEIR